MIHPKNLHKCFARLACVKHAASVHPEPGSKFSLAKILIPLNLLWFCSLRTIFFWTFKDMSLFSYQGSFFVAVSAATSLLYQTLFCLSRTFLTFFKSFFKVLSQLTQRVLILSLFFAVVNNFFQLFEFFIFFCLFRKNTEKEGFEPSHRVNGLHP